ncbi:rho GTPase-activating protein 26-like [Sinocyclocheilus grahami]|uniref:rho GTPase-activating protein 26-like n=1 Tax=Sinocyclocheilus grahami TaxID=75366 RepID=UPI0007AD3E12|nr:PREDICTED: rho GTPase-activating protein 26-like [Sinocyclocheilus grahami]
MGLPALEFSDCYVDSPQFRERLKSHELELEKTNKFIKELIKDGKALIQALKNLSTAKRKFAESLNEFKFQCIGDAETDDEICIAKSLQEFAGVLQNLEDERTRMIENASDVLILPLERFRKEQIGAAKLSIVCCVFIKPLLCLNKMFEFVEPLLAFLQGLFTYYHHGYELAKDFNHFKTDLTISIQNTRNRFESTRSEVECLMKKMKENPHEHKSISPHTIEGYLFVQEKRSFVSTWVKYYCIYHREPKRMTMMLFDQKSGAKNGDEESFTLKSCTRRKTDSIEKRFCFDIEAVDRPGMITMQAQSEEDRRLWMEAMDGREPVYTLNRDSQNEAMAQLDVLGFNIVKKFIYAIETRDPKTCADVELNSTEWEIKTITSAIKHYLRMLPAPLMTYQYQRSFIKAAKLDNPEARVAEIHSIVHRLPEKNRQMLELLMKHLAKVASHHLQNLMTVANLGVVFGPTLLRPQEETVAAIMDIKFQNIVVEILIENHERIFKDMPVSGGGQGNSQLNLPRRRSADSKAPSCSERPLTLFHTPSFSEKDKAVEKRNSMVVNSSADLSSVNCNSTLSWTRLDSLPTGDGDHDGLQLPKQSRPNSLQNPKVRSSISTSPASPSPTSPRSPSWPMFSAPSSPSSESSPVSPPPRKARARYACKAEHDSELSFIAGTIFENGKFPTAGSPFLALSVLGISG